MAGREQQSLIWFSQAGEAPGPGNREPLPPQLPTAAGQAVFLTSWLWTHPIILLSSCYQRIQDENKKQIPGEACVMSLQEKPLQHISIPDNTILSYPPEKGEHACCSPLAKGQGSCAYNSPHRGRVLAPSLTASHTGPGWELCHLAAITLRTPVLFVQVSKCLLPRSGQSPLHHTAIMTMKENKIRAHESQVEWHTSALPALRSPRQGDGQPGLQSEF